MVVAVDCVTGISHDTVDGPSNGTVQTNSKV